MSKKHKCCRCLKMGEENKMNQYPFNKKWFHDPKCPKESKKKGKL